MNKGFDMGKADKQMPYTTSNAFFDKLEENIWNEVKDEYLAGEPEMNGARALPLGVSAHRKASRWRLAMRSVMAVAACAAVAFVVNVNSPETSAVSVNDVDRAFSQLSSDDQAYLLSVYQNDVFINQ